MPDTVCAPRLEELAAQRDELLDYRDDLIGRIQSSATQALPNRGGLESVAAELDTILREGRPEPVKAALESLIDRIEITRHREAQPYFLIPVETTTPEPKARACNGNGVRMVGHHVELRVESMSQHANPVTALPGPFLRLRIGGSAP